MSVFKRLTNLARGKAKALRRDWSDHQADPDDILDEDDPLAADPAPVRRDAPADSAPEPADPKSDEPPEPRKKRL